MAQKKKNYLVWGVDFTYFELASFHLAYTLSYKGSSILATPVPNAQLHKQKIKKHRLLAFRLLLYKDHCINCDSYLDVIINVAPSPQTRELKRNL